eukprot:CAMPEP_0170538444 /NCGR_PEP_ID=MMETSP0209-20121228/103311_1 /TAXON_ID=665100 ORGANISM="Litonotus pictus, Strain P1" /NCGR_SAMPLE_ID=MMETSP0209 /ASSEMBLY_ACC=CAM_ASM_000301 /LENGTH=3072 /DNA_ID=CAMNT_0010840135 /DNA_START=28 /DNA_END=9246 /DNA_ORIENTATION=-
MNPDYAGRSQLPDNLKGQFRPLAMMIPQYEMITEIMLYSFGFTYARSLANKIVSSLTLASEQLSSQIHYDYGMRTLSGIIQYIGILAQDRKIIKASSGSNNNNEINTSLEIQEGNKEGHLSEEEVKLLEKKEEEYIGQKAIRDSNMPKFTLEDYNIYEGILGDLFPNSEFVQKEDEILVNSINNSLIRAQLPASKYIENKIVDFHNIMSVRHAVMIVGEPMTSKSTIIKTYIDMANEYYHGISESKYNNQDIPANTFYNKKIQHKTINPKSVTSAQLFGWVNKKTQEFTEGICSKILRDYFADNESNDNKLLIFDGPVDTMWIENMNSVLDDTKKLCLENSDLIRLDDKTLIIFEIDDLSQASLATISRCGMVYTDRNNINSNEYFYAWLDSLPISMRSDKSVLSDFLKNLYTSMFLPLISEFMFDEFNNLKFRLSIPFYKNWLIRNFVMVLEALLLKNSRKEDIIQSELEKEQLLKDQENNNIMAITANTVNEKSSKKSTMGIKLNIKQLSKQEKKDLLSKFIVATLVTLNWIIEKPENKKQFSDYFFKLVKDLSNTESFMLKDDLFGLTKFFIGKDLSDIVYNHGVDTMFTASEFLKANQQTSIDELVNKTTILIPTKDTIKASFMVNLALSHRFPLMLYGGTSSGKSLLLKNVFNEMTAFSTNETDIVDKLNKKGLLKPNYTMMSNTFIILNAKTSANNLCDIMEEKIAYRLKKNTLAPGGNKTCVMLIEDLNMPVKESFGAQPPIEILRQNFDYEGWYDRKENDFLYMKNVLFFSCLTLGRPLVSGRLTWHFLPFFFRDMDEASLKSVYQTFYSANMFSYPNSVRKLEIFFSDILISTYSLILKTFKPLPATPHYSFNVRDLNKVYEGFLMVPPSVFAAELNPSEKLQQLVVNEILRVFYDRLVDESHRETFVKEVIGYLEKAFNKNFSVKFFPTEGESSFDHGNSAGMSKRGSLVIVKENTSNINNSNSNLVRVGGSIRKSTNISNSNYNPFYFEDLMFTDLNEESVFLKVADIYSFKIKLENYLHEYNQGKRSKEKMDLIFFDYSLKHLVRLDRMFLKENEHGILVGLTGSGRESLTLLSSYIKKFKLFKIRGKDEVEDYQRKDWQEDIKTLFIQTGLRRESTVFVIKDNSINEESYYVDLNCIISSGIVYNLFTNDEKIDLISQLRNIREIEEMNLPDDQAVWKTFIEVAMSHMRIIICLNPLNEKFTKTLRTFPAFINNTYIDWFLNWPEPALYELAKRELMQIKGLEKFAHIDLYSESHSQNLSQSSSMKNINSNNEENENKEHIIVKGDNDNQKSPKEESGVNESNASESNVSSVGEGDKRRSKIKKGTVSSNTHKPVFSEIKESPNEVEDNEENEEKEKNKADKKNNQYNSISSNPPNDDKIDPEKFEIVEKLSNVLSKTFCKIISFNEGYCKQTRKRVIILPKTFLDCVNFFKSFAINFVSGIENQIKKYKGGVKKIEEAEIAIQQTSELLEVKKPILIEKEKFMQTTIQEIEVQTAEAQKYRAQCEEKEKEAMEKKEEAERKRTIADFNIAEAEDIKNKINTKISSIDVKMYSQLRSYRIPPKEIAKMMQAITAVTNNFEKKPLEILPSEWDYYKKKMNDKKYLDNLISLPKRLESQLLTEKSLKLLEVYVSDQALEPHKMLGISSACEIFCIYFRSMHQLDGILKNKLIPSKLESEAATKSFNFAQEELDYQKKNLMEIEQKLDELNKAFQEKNREKINLQIEISESEKKLARAQKLSTKLVTERVRWKDISEDLENNLIYLLGDSIVAVIYMSFLAPYVDTYRDIFIRRELFRVIKESDVLVREKTSSISKIVGNPFKIQEWLANGLPSDEGNIDNAIVMFDSLKPVLLMDPQKQGIRFLMKLYMTSFIIYKKLDDMNSSLNLIEKCIREGRVIIFDYINYDISTEIEIIINAEIYYLNPDPESNQIINLFSGNNYLQGNKKSQVKDKEHNIAMSIQNFIHPNGKIRVLKLGENLEVPVHPGFKFFLVSYNPNPVFNSELYGKITMVNFTVTKSGLTEQLLNVITKEEAPNEEAERISILQRQSELAEKLHSFEEEILGMLELGNDMLLENDSLINKLEDAKRLADDANIQMNQAKTSEERIQAFRSNYLSLANLASIAFFTIQELCLIEDVYYFSINWFISFLLEKSIREIPNTKKANFKERVSELKDNLLVHSYQGVCRSLYNKDKTLFAFLLLTRYFESDGHISSIHTNFLFKDLLEKTLSSEDAEFIKKFNTMKPDFIESEKTWQSVLKLSLIDDYSGLADDFINQSSEYSEWVQKTKETVSLDQPSSSLSNSKNERRESKEGKEKKSSEQKEKDQKYKKKKTEIPSEEVDKENSIKHYPKEYQLFNFPEKYNSLSTYKKLLLIKIFAIDKLNVYINKILEEVFVKEMAVIPLYTVNQLLEMSVSTSPLFLLLSLGIDPTGELKRLAEENGRELMMVSLGQGQAAKTISAIEIAQRKGEWIFLQNLHLVSDFMRPLEQIISNLSTSSEKEVLPTFRLWLSALPSKDILPSVLMNSIKTTLESPVGVKSNILKLFQAQEKSWRYENEVLRKVNKDYEFSKFMICLIHFHAIIIERKNYGPLGWNIGYNFGLSDFLISKSILKYQLQSYEEIPFKAIKYLYTDCIYGGRVTENLDRRTLHALLSDFFSQNILDNENTIVNNCKEYTIDYLDDYTKYLTKFELLPEITSPEVVGLHKNALIKKDSDSNMNMLRSLGTLDIGSTEDHNEEKQENKSKSSEANLKQTNETNKNEVNPKMKILKQIVEEAEKRLIKGFNIDIVRSKFPLEYKNCMNSILIQEVMRYNSLLKLVFTNLKDVTDAYNGLLPLTDEIEVLSNSLIANKTPESWISRSYPSRKPIMSWIIDLQQRIEFFLKWEKEGTPEKFWFSAFFFTQAFLTGIKQNYAREHGYGINDLDFIFEFVDKEKPDEIIEAKVKSRKAYYTYGLYLEGAEWDSQSHRIAELKMNRIYYYMPPILIGVYLVKEENRGSDEKRELEMSRNLGFKLYRCPVYKCSSRQGSLSTTGHSTNFIFNILLHSDLEENHWIKRGVALLNQLDD